jgi:flagellar hook-associated protein 2
VNGSSTVLQSDSRQVTLSPGLTATILDTSSQPVTVTVTKGYTSLQTALSNFAAVYNSAVGTVGKQIGQNAGALAGQSIVYTLTGVLQGFSHYASGSGAVSSLNDVGLSVDKTGQMSFDVSTFTDQSAAAIEQFLGSADSGGFMKAATDALSHVDDVTTGDLQSEFDGLKTQIDHKNQLILDQQTRISQMQANLQAELAEADAAIANLQAQKSYYQELFQAQYNNNGSSG